MSTFQEVNDASLIELISKAQRRVIFVAPGVHTAVAEELGKRFAEIDQLQVTVVIDPDEDVCRIGYGDAKGLALLSDYATPPELCVGGAAWAPDRRAPGG